jgi:hypothetical protein
MDAIVIWIRRAVFFGFREDDLTQKGRDSRERTLISGIATEQSKL